MRSKLRKWTSPLLYSLMTPLVLVLFWLCMLADPENGFYAALKIVGALFLLDFVLTFALPCRIKNGKFVNAGLFGFSVPMNKVQKIYIGHGTINEKRERKNKTKENTSYYVKVKAYSIILEGSFGLRQSIKSTNKDDVLDVISMCKKYASNHHLKISISMH
ncbi:hypothetical protein [Helicobacter cetorum]|uniref:hypothetical protein n=1 Tax=Helicobacter cetorum TaxID=138563 RepID=UPI000CF11B38|nr:hypothetical protein [Helicobacter cetorum]